ncbi:MAG: glycosyltransferase family 2 protein [Planctomycetes bacterium]|nr:glycosyltransferase family 2 protein [Planctomycetota bacterium]
MRDVAVIDAEPALGAATTVTVVVHWRGAEDTLHCIASLRTHAADTPVVVVDNASTDDSAALLQAAWRNEPLVRIERTAHNGGFGAGANAGIGAALAAWPRLRHVLLLNPDARLTPGALPAMLATAARHPEAGIVGCRILDASGQRIWFGNGRIPRWTLSGFHVAAPSGRTEHRAGFITGCTMLLDAAMLRAGLRFDEGFFLYAEDADLCARVVAAGRQLWVTQQATVHHRGGGSHDGTEVLPGQTSSQLYWLTRSKVRFARRHLTAVQRAWFWFAALLLKPVAGLLLGHGVAFVRPYLRGLRDGFLDPVPTR